MYTGLLNAENVHRKKTGFPFTSVLIQGSLGPVWRNALYKQDGNFQLCKHMWGAEQPRKREWVATCIQNLGVETVPFVRAIPDPDSQTSSSCRTGHLAATCFQKGLSPLCTEAVRGAEKGTDHRISPCFGHISRAHLSSLPPGTGSTWTEPSAPRLQASLLPLVLSPCGWGQVPYLLRAPGSSSVK